MENEIHVSNKMVSRLYVNDVEAMCSQHACKPETSSKFEAINVAAANFIQALMSHCPSCADAQTALRCIREARMWANSSIALDSNNWEESSK